MRTLFTRRLQAPAPPGTPTNNPTPAPAVRLRFATRGGAQVHVHHDGSIHCQGCDYDKDWGPIAHARTQANSHASGCWSMPKLTPDA